MISARKQPTEGWTSFLDSLRHGGRVTRRDRRKHSPVALSQALETRVLLSADPVLSSPVAAIPGTRYESESPTDAFHQIGEATADGWSASVDQDDTGFLVYGPYTTDLDAGWHTASFILQVDNNDADNLPVVRIDVYDASTGTVLQQATLTRQQFDDAGVYQNFDLTFYSEEGANLEFRTYWLDTSYVLQDAVEVVPVTTSGTTYQAETDLAHQIGRVDGDGWSANVTDDDAGYLTYGPYTTSLPPGIYSAEFRLMIDNNTFDDGDVVTIDVVSDEGNTVLAQRTITRTEFEQVGTYQNFRLDFINTTGEELEFRTYWHDTAYVKQDLVTVTEVPVSLAATFEAETDLEHQIGRAEADGWSADVAQDTAGYLAYGPYTSAITEGLHVALFRLMVDNVTADNLPVVTIDVVADAGQTVLAQRTITRNEFDTALDYQSFALPFVNTAGQELEFRVNWLDTSYVLFDNVRVQSVPIAQNIFEAEDSTNHLVGRLEGNAWSANVDQDSAGYLMYGPYTTNVQAGANTASFRLLVDNTTANNDGVVRIDVFDASTGTILAQRSITRSEFNTPFVYQDFELDFDSSSDGVLEFRTFYDDTSYVRLDNVRVFPSGFDDASLAQVFEEMDLIVT